MMLNYLLKFYPVKAKIKVNSGICNRKSYKIITKWKFYEQNGLTKIFVFLLVKGINQVAILKEMIMMKGKYFINFKCYQFFDSEISFN